MQSSVKSQLQASFLRTAMGNGSRHQGRNSVEWLLKSTDLLGRRDECYAEVCEYLGVTLMWRNSGFAVISLRNAPTCCRMRALSLLQN